jgi:hypothetical protein
MYKWQVVGVKFLFNFLVKIRLKLIWENITLFEYI